MKRLGVNIDHIATIRNVRGENHPKIIEAANNAGLIMAFTGIRHFKH